VSVRGRGINCGTGFASGGHCSRPFSDPDQVEREMRVIAGDRPKESCHAPAAAYGQTE
jgi:hypothetical protein